MSDISGRSRRHDIGAAAARQFQLAEMPRERHLPLVVEILAAQHQDRVAVDRLAERPHRRRVERPPDIDPADLADKQRMQLSHRDSHHSRSSTAATGHIRRPPRPVRRDRPATGRNRAVFRASSGPCRGRGRPRSAGCGGSGRAALPAHDLDPLVALVDAHVVAEAAQKAGDEIGEFPLAGRAVAVAQHEIGIDAAPSRGAVPVGRHRMAVDMPDRAELAIQPLARFVEHPVIGRVVALDAGQHVLGVELAVVDRHAGLGVPAHQPDPRHRPRLQRRSGSGRVSIAGSKSSAARLTSI